MRFSSTSVGFESIRIETFDFAFQTDPDHFLALRTRVGLSAQRLETLPTGTRRALIDRARSALAAMKPGDFVLRSRVILAFAETI